MPSYEVRRLTTLSFVTVEAASEDEARFLAREVWVADAKIAAGRADVTRIPNLDPADAALDHRSELRYEETEGDRDHERIHAQRWSEGETDAYHDEMQRLRDELR